MINDKGCCFIDKVFDFLLNSVKYFISNLLKILNILNIYHNFLYNNKYYLNKLI